MSFFISLGICLLAMLIQASLHLSSGVFSIFYHHAAGRFSSKKSGDLALYFILGAETFTAIMFLAIYMATRTILSYFTNLSLLPWIMGGVFSALAIAVFFFYFRRGQSTELFISRRVAKNLSLRASSVKTKSDAFLLGLFSNLAELLFTFPIYIALAIILSESTVLPRTLLAMGYILSSIIPIIPYFFLYQAGYNFAEISRRRIKNKTFFRIMLTLGFVLLAIASFNMGVIR